MGPFCYACGQKQQGVDRFFLSLVGEALDNIFSLDSRTAKTMFGLFFRPGFLTSEYFAGRRARYIQPLRLYLIVSLVFFLILSIENLTSETPMMQIDDKDPVAAQPKADADAASETSSTPNRINSHINLPWLSAEENHELDQRLENQIHKAIALVKADPQQAMADVIDAAPPLLFILLPLFAFLLKLIYIGSSRYYTQHLILAVHNHSFMFLALLLAQLLSGIVLLWAPIYMFLSLRKVYGQGYFVTTLKFIVLVLCYQFLFITVFAMGILANVMTL